jgi:hypothetical protein
MVQGCSPKFVRLLFYEVRKSRCKDWSGILRIFVWLPHGSATPYPAVLGRSSRADTTGTRNLVIHRFPSFGSCLTAERFSLR